MRDYNSKKWQRTRLAVLERSSGLCECCGVEPGVHVHHHVYNANDTVGGEPLDWLEHVCLDCHIYYHPTSSKLGEPGAERRRRLLSSRARTRRCAFVQPQKNNRRPRKKKKNRQTTQPKRTRYRQCWEGCRCTRCALTRRV